MFKRISVISSVALAVLLVAGLAYGAVAPASQAGATSPDVVADNSSPSDDPTADDTSRTDSKDDPSDDSRESTATTTTTVAAASADDTSATDPTPTGGIYPVDEAGTVEIAVGAAGLELITATPNEGFEISRTRTEPDNISVKFRAGSLEVEFEAELEDGALTAKVTREAADESDDDTSSDDPSDDDSSTKAEASPTADMTETYDAGAAGTVTITVANGMLTLDGTTENDGWSITKTRTQSDEIKVEFRNGSQEVEFEAELHNGHLETKIETKTSDNENDDSSSDNT